MCTGEGLAQASSFKPRDVQTTWKHAPCRCGSWPLTGICVVSGAGAGPSMMPLRVGAGETEGAGGGDCWPLVADIASNKTIEGSSTSASI